MDALFLISVCAVVGIVVLTMVGVSIYNRLVTARNRYENAFSQIDVQLKRRYDLIPNLVEVAKGYMQHEQETLEKVIAARNDAASAARTASKSPGDATAMGGLMSAEGLLSGMMGRFLAVAEAYPDLKADTQMQQLIEELTSTENRIAFARQAFNDMVTSFNTLTETFPNSAIAGTFSFRRAELLEFATERVAEPPKVSFS
jgi:LemA protein